jgi:hypothetical protein
MGKKAIRSLVLGIIFILAFSSLAFADDMNMNNGTTKKADDTNVKLSFKNEKVKTGNNDIMITLKDSNNQPISDAKVTATAQMDKNMNMSMGDNKPQSIEFKTGDEMGQYMGTVNFTDKGKWIVTATVNVNGQDKNIDFDVDVAGSGPNWLIIGGFSGVIVLIIVFAAIKKKQTAKA